MAIKRQMKKLIENLTGTHIYKILPRGVDLFQDISNLLPTLHVDIVFDVGANVGQSAEMYLGWFPNAQIYCFEPVTETFRQLQEKARNHGRIHCYQLAFGASKKKGEMILQGPSEMFFLQDPARRVLVDGAAMREEVRIEALDEFCDGIGINQISYLKIDTEGWDLEVLRGAERMLDEKRVDLLEVEAGMNCTNERHVPFDDLKRYLEPKSYFLFGIYEQVEEWPTNEPHLRRANPVFISRHTIEANRGKRAY